MVETEIIPGFSYPQRPYETYQNHRSVVMFFHRGSDRRRRLVPRFRYSIVHRVLWSISCIVRGRLGKEFFCRPNAGISSLLPVRRCRLHQCPLLRGFLLRVLRRTRGILWSRHRLIRGLLPRIVGVGSQRRVLFLFSPR